ncbi:hypothetical protein [Marinobacterium sp. BA1]|uniref:hypothetical protein n=1 Tax=Marinobacterium sp. BA1 TaxID=3138931 RepID=UPI0032E53CD4
MPTLKSPDTPEILNEFRNAFTDTDLSRSAKSEQAPHARDNRPNRQIKHSFQWLEELSHIEMAARTVNHVQAMADEVINQRADREFDRLMDWITSPAKASDDHSNACAVESTSQNDLNAGKADTSETLADILTRIASSPAAGKHESPPNRAGAPDFWSQLLESTTPTIDTAQSAHALKSTTPEPITDVVIDITGLEALLEVSLSVLERITPADLEQIATGVDTATSDKLSTPKAKAISKVGSKRKPNPSHPLSDNHAGVHTHKPKGRRIPASEAPLTTIRASRNDARGHLTLRDMQGAADPNIRTLDELKIDEAIALATGDPEVKVKVTAKADDIEALNAAEAERIRQKIRARREARTFEREARPSASRVLLEKPQQIAQSLDLDISSLIDEIEERKRNQRPAHDSRDRTFKKRW